MKGVEKGMRGVHGGQAISLLPRWPIHKVQPDLQTREGFRLLIQYITGHAFLGRHDQIVENGNKEGAGTKAGTCRYCKMRDETPHHLIIDWEMLSEKKNDWFASRRNPTYFYKWKIHQILGVMELSKLTSNPPDPEEGEEGEEAEVGVHPTLPQQAEQNSDREGSGGDGLQ